MNFLFFVIFQDLGSGREKRGRRVRQLASDVSERDPRPRDVQPGLQRLEAGSLSRKIRHLKRKRLIWMTSFNYLW